MWVGGLVLFAGVTSQVLKREGRLASGVYKGYVYVVSEEPHSGYPERW